MIVLQHNQITKKSIPVAFIQQIQDTIPAMADLCRQKIGHYNRGLAIAHCQFDAINPMTFFVMADGSAVVNPKIITVSEKSLIDHMEGCMSFKDRKPICVKRYRRIKVNYIFVSNDGHYKTVEKWVNDQFAFIMQHEIDHFNLKYIYEN